MAVNGIELKVGQVWKTRGGEVVTITGFDPLKTDEHTCEADPFPVHIGGDRYVDTDGLYGPGDAPHALDLSTLVVSATPDTAYAKLADVLNRALLQASQGKGRERHATGDTPFEEQPMATINRQLGSVHGFIYQAHKKSLEAMRLPAGRDVAELLGAINYLCGAVIALESWAAKKAD